MKIEVFARVTLANLPVWRLINRIYYKVHKLTRGIDAIFLWKYCILYFRIFCQLFTDMSVILLIKKNILQNSVILNFTFLPDSVITS